MDPFGSIWMLSCLVWSWGTLRKKSKVKFTEAEGGVWKMGPFGSNFASPRVHQVGRGILHLVLLATASLQPHRSVSSHTCSAVRAGLRL